METMTLEIPDFTKMSTAELWQFINYCDSYTLQVMAIDAMMKRKEN